MAPIFPGPIALTGFMGAGKTAVGELLARRLRRPFHDTDRHVEAAAMRTVEDFFASGQEAAFRELEAVAVADLVGLGAVVIALGGGALLDPGSRKLLQERSLLVHLHVPWAQLRPRLPELTASRPLLRGRSQAQVHRLYLERLESYRAAAVRVTLPRTGLEAAVDELIRRLHAPPVR